MKRSDQKKKPLAKAPVNRGRGRPRTPAVKQNVTLRFDAELLEQIDAWAEDHGGMGRSAAIRFAARELVRK